MRNIEGIKIVDATIRDGGLVNDFFFTDDFVKKVYETNVRAGIDYMEFGYRADKKMFDPSKFGKWKFANDDDIYNIVGDNNTNLKLCAMADVGRCDFKNDIQKKSESPLSLFRVATYIDTIPEAVEMIEFIANQGYDTTCNIMAISKCTLMQISRALDVLAQSPVKGVYIVDSFGALYPQDIRKLTKLFYDKLVPYGKLTGIHAHNNQQCAFANTIEAHDCGAKMLDSTMYGMGRGAGNCHTEALLGYFNGNKYHIEPALNFVESDMLAQKDLEPTWGYNTSYLISGLANAHPRDAIAASKKKDLNFIEQYKFHMYK